MAVGPRGCRPGWLSGEPDGAAVRRPGWPVFSAPPGVAEQSVLAGGRNGMRKLAWALTGLVVIGLLALVPAGPVRAADAPMELAGIRLGKTVEELGAKLVTSSADKAFQRPCLGLVAVAPVAGFRSGYVDYGLCAKPGRIVRIKMNYADESLGFYERLLTALKKRYGEPTQWRGNAFGTLRTWKWGLKAANGRSISLILMHYEGDDGAFTEGNSIRIADTDMVREEEQCQTARLGADKAGQEAEKKALEATGLGLDWFLPR